MRLDETIHQSTRLRIMTMLVSQPVEDRLAYGFIQSALELTGGNLTTHLRKLEEAEYLVMTKEFVDSKPRTWVQATATGRRAFRGISGEFGEGFEVGARMGRACDGGWRAGNHSGQSESIIAPEGTADAEAVGEDAGL